MTALLTRRRCVLTIAPYALLALAAWAGAPFVGSERVRPGRVWADFRQPSDRWSADTRILLHHRLPRVTLGLLAGGSLALVGGVYQVVLRNPLATPYTLGVTGGAAVGAYLACAFPRLAVSFGPFSAIQLLALVGAVATLSLIWLLARGPQGASMNTLLLAGVTVGILCGALLLLIRYLANPEVLVSMDRWLMGGLDIVGYGQLIGLLPLLLPGWVLLWAQQTALNHLALGEEMALGHGIDVAAVQRQGLVGGALVTAAVVSLAGPIAFVGLLIPHIVRRLSGLDHRVVLPASFCGGGAFLVACDTLARTLVAPTEIPVGVFTALLGGPFFLWLLFRRSSP